MKTEEMFDVVDEHDQVIGQRTRREVHKLGLRHRAVHVLVFNSHGQLFLQKRSMTKDCFPGTWDSSSSGHLEPGETYEACARRELQEELGLTLAEPPCRLFKVAACPETGQEFVWVYRGQADGPFQLQPEEIETGDWFYPDQVTAWIARRPEEFASGFVLIWRRWMAEGCQTPQGRRP
jgi:isopentenyl-diphosphate delta-isomerase type 1